MPHRIALQRILVHLLLSSITLLPHIHSFILGCITCHMKKIKNPCPRFQAEKPFSLNIQEFLID